MGIGSSKQVLSPQRAMRMMSVVITGATPALGGICEKNMTLVKNGAGDYTLTFSEPFKQVPQVFPALVTTGLIASIAAVSKTAVQILTKDTALTLTDAVVEVMILGSDTVDQI